MAKKEFKIGEVFQCGLVKLKVEKPEIGLCKGCFFNSSFYDCESIANLTGPCSWDEREDKESVIFKEVEDYTMTPEEYIKSKRHEEYPGGQLCYTVSEETALEAVRMAREDKNNSAIQNTGIFGQQGWICPKCGRVYSPFTSMCSYCSNDNIFKITCMTK